MFKTIVNPINQKRVAPSGPEYQHLKRVTEMSDAQFLNFLVPKKWGYDRADYERLRGYKVGENGAFQRRVGDIRFKVMYRLELYVEFRHNYVENDPYRRVSFSFLSYAYRNEEERLALIHRAFIKKMNKHEDYVYSYTGNYEVVSLTRINRKEKYEFHIPMRSRTAMLNSLYNSEFGMAPEQSEHKMCVPNYLLTLSRKAKENNREDKTKACHLTLMKIREQFKVACAIDAENDPVTPAQMIQWHTMFHSQCCSLYLLDGMVNTIHELGTKSRRGLSIMMICTNYHCYGIIDHKQKVSKKGVGEFVNMDIKRNTKHRAIELKTIKAQERADLVQGKLDDQKDIILILESIAPMQELNDAGEFVTVPTAIEQLCLDIITETKIVPYGFQLDSNRRMASFFHPISHQNISVTVEWEKRKEMCDYLYEKMPVHQFTFINQSYSEIGSALFMAKFCSFDGVSNYTEKTQRYYRKWCTSPFNCGINDTGPEGGSYGVKDYVTCYPNTILSMPDEAVIPVFDSMETPEPYQGGMIHDNAFYFHDKVDLFGGWWERPQFSPGKYVKSLIKQGYLTFCSN